MKRKRLIILSIFAAFSLFGCDTDSNNSSEIMDSSILDGSVSETTNSNGISESVNIGTNDSSDNIFKTYSEEDYNKNFPTYKQLSEKYPDKTILVWTIQETLYERNYPFYTYEVNEYLDSLGCDYCVCFYPIRADRSEDETKSYTDYVTEMIENGDQVDIVYSSFTSVDEAGNNAFHKYIYNGVFEPLNKYFETELGMKLYENMPAEHWQALTVDGSIYGIDGSMHSLSDDYGYFINSELAKKYKFDIATPIEDQIDILQEVKSNENCDVFVSYNDFNTASYIVDIKEITGAVYFDEDEMKAKCILDNPEFMDKLRFMYDLKQKNYLVDPDHTTTDTFFILRTNLAGGKEHYKNFDTVDITYNNRTVTTIPVFIGDTTVRSSYMATGISSSSEHKDQAFEILALTQTDPYLNNLLTYGKEGEDYHLADGKVDTIINPVSLDRFPNRMICYPTSSTLITSEEYKAIYKNANCSETVGFAFDGRDVIPQSSATSRLFMTFDFLSVDDLDTAIKDLRSQLEQSGIKDVIDACNQQYEEYKNE